MKYLRQIIFEMRHQKMMTWVSISGTALAIFLIMVFFMADNARTVSVSPESNRSRILYANSLHQRYLDKERNRSGALSYNVAEKLYGNLEGIEKRSYVNGYVEDVNVNVKGKDYIYLTERLVDENFWKIFDFRFVEGKPFDEAACKSEEKIAVISESAARELFNSGQAVGKEIYIDNNPYRVTGVVKDVNPLLKSSYAQVYIPLSPFMLKWENGMLGQLAVFLLMKEGVEREEIMEQVKERYAMLNNELAKDRVEVVYHQSPYDAELIAAGEDDKSMADPDLSEYKRDNAIVYTLLLLLPAINLGCMTRGRLRRRVSEIGVRRAFGAKRSSIMWQFLGENMVITLIGGVIGLALSVVFMLTFSHLFFTFAAMQVSTSLELSYPMPTLPMLMTWGTFLIALGGCLVLNVLSTTLPAWKASRVEPAVAIAKVKV